MKESAHECARRDAIRKAEIKKRPNGGGAHRTTKIPR